MIVEKLKLREDPTILLKILLLRGKFEEASNLCMELGLQKWALLFNIDISGNDQSSKTLLHLQPHQEMKKELQIFNELFQIPKAFWYDNTLKTLVDKLGEILKTIPLSIKDQEMEDVMKRYMQWAFLLTQCEINTKGNMPFYELHFLTNRDPRNF